MNSHVKPGSESVIPPSQKRGRDTQAKLVAATRKLLDQTNFETLSVAEITAEAGVAVGTFYRRFTSKEALLPLLYEEYNRIFAAWLAKIVKDEGFSSPDVRTRVRTLVQKLQSFYSQHAGLIRALHLNSRLNNEIVPAFSVPLRKASYAKVAELIEPNVPEDRRGEIADAIMLILLSTIVEALIYPEQSPAIVAGLDSDRLTEALTRAALAQLPD